MAAVSETIAGSPDRNFEEQQFGNELTAALDLLEHTAIEHGEQRNHPDLIDCLISVGVTYYDHGYYCHALNHFKQALEMATLYYKTLSSCYIFGDIHTHIANASSRLCRYNLARKHYGAALQIKIEIYPLGTQNIQLAENYKNLGKTCLETGDYDKAHENNFSALSMVKSIHGCRGHSDVAEAYADIADVFVEQGEFTQALEYYTRSLQATKEWLGNDAGVHVDIAKCYLKLANMYLSQTKYNKATEVARKSLQMYQAIYGEESRHHTIAGCFKVLGDICNQRNSNENALSHYKLAYSKLCDYTGKRAFAVEPRWLAEVCTAMAAVYSSLSHYTEAKGYNDEAIRMFETYGPGGCHPALALACKQAAEIDQKVNGNDSEGALNMYLRSMNMCVDMYGENSPRQELFQILADVGQAYDSQFNIRQSLCFYLRSLKILNSICDYRGKKSLTLAYNCDTIAGLYQQSGDNIQALHYYIQALEVKEMCRASDSNKNWSYSHIGAAYDALGNFDKSLEFHRLVGDKVDIGIALCHSGNFHEGRNHLLTALRGIDQDSLNADLVNLYCSIANSYYDDADGCIDTIEGNRLITVIQFGHALDYYGKAMKIIEPIYGSNRCGPGLAKIHSCLGLVLQQSSIRHAESGEITYPADTNYEESLDHHRQALRMRKQLYRENNPHPELALAYNNIGVVYYLRGDYRLSLENLNMALQTYSQFHAENTEQPEIANLHENLGNVYFAQKHYMRSLGHYSLCLEIRTLLFGDCTNHSKPLASVYVKLSYLHHQLGNNKLQLKYQKIAERIADPPGHQAQCSCM